MNKAKAFFCSIFFILLSQTINAQTKQGYVMLGGESNLNFTFLNSKWQSDNNYAETGKTTIIEFAPQVGYFVIDGLSVGIELPIAYSSTKNEDKSTNKTSSYAATPFLRYYFGDTREKIKPYMHASGGIGNKKREITSSSGETTIDSGNLYLVNLGVGAGYFVSKRLSIDLGVRLISSTFKPKENNTDNYREIDSGFILKLGVVVFL